MIVWEDTKDWLLEHGTMILVILAISLITYFIIRKTLPPVIRRTLSHSMKDQPQVEIEKREITLTQLTRTTTTIIICVISLFLILNEIGINIAALLAGFGVVGIAVGFGAQSIVKDILSGFTIELENQFNVGDVIKAAGVTGIVDSFNLRRTTLRDLDGILHFIPNGDIRVASNFTRSWSRAHLDIPVAYKEDTDHVMTTIRTVWEEVAEDETWGPLLMSKTPWLLRVNEFGDKGVIIKVVGETQPMKQWDLMGELRRRIKKAFDDQNIEIPWQYTKVYFGDSLEVSEKQESDTIP